MKTVKTSVAAHMRRTQNIWYKFQFCGPVYMKQVLFRAVQGCKRKLVLIVPFLHNSFHRIVWEFGYLYSI